MELSIAPKTAKSLQDRLLETILALLEGGGLLEAVDSSGTMAAACLTRELTARLLEGIAAHQAAAREAAGGGARDAPMEDAEGSESEEESEDEPFIPMSREEWAADQAARAARRAEVEARVQLARRQQAEAEAEAEARMAQLGVAEAGGEGQLV